MANLIRQVRISQRSLSPVEADLLIEVELETNEPDLELRGRLVGPTCAYATTIEVSYPLRMLPRADAAAPLQGRLVIPEPSWWDPISPFLYQGRVEVRRRGALLESAHIRCGLRWLQLKPEGLFWNGKRLMLRVADRLELSESELTKLRRQGINALILPSEANELWADAERLGFVVIGRLEQPDDRPAALELSPAFLGWLIPANLDQHGFEQALERDASSQLRIPVGIENAGPSRDEIHFFVEANDSQVIVRLLRGGDGELGQIV